MQPACHPRPSPPRGFTLLEAAIVVTVIGILILIAAPTINFAKLRTKSAMQTLGTTMLAVQREAVGRQHNMIVMFDTAQASLRILYDSTNDLTEDNGERVRTIPLGEGIVFGRPSAVPARPFGSSPVDFTTLVSGLPAVVFYRNGSAKESGGLYLSSREAMRGMPRHQAETWAMELIRASGRAEWMRWTGTAWQRGF
jgi:prepilin-type N-terminal cleavage/methylation domain-containing protein